ncbi:MAG: hypothetical protein HUJ54_05755, partial [Erysipelotrichaceae bacterium]|nr:hypothetical protein [Erysipelotrichaceae bacterium]
MLKNPFKKLEKKLHSEVNLEYTVKTGFILIDSEESSVYNLPHVLKKSLKTMNIHEKKETGHLDALQAALNDLCSHKSQNDLRCIICKDGTVIQLKNFDFMDSSLIQLSVHFPSDPKHHENRLMDHLSKHPFGKRNPDHLHNVETETQHYQPKDDGKEQVFVSVGE